MSLIPDIALFLTYTGLMGNLPSIPDQIQETKLRDSKRQLKRPSASINRASDTTSAWLPAWDLAVRESWEVAASWASGP